MIRNRWVFVACFWAACSGEPPESILVAEPPAVETPVEPPVVEPVAAPPANAARDMFPTPPTETRCTRTSTCRSLVDGFESIEIGPETDGPEQQTIWNTRVRCQRQVVPIGAVSVSCLHRNVEGFEDMDAYVQYVRDEYGPETSAVIAAATRQKRYTWREGPYQLDIQHHVDLRTYYVRMPTR